MWQSFSDILSDIHDARRRLLAGETKLEVAREELKTFGHAAKILQLQLQHGALTGAIKTGSGSALPDVELAGSRANWPAAEPTAPPALPAPDVIDRADAADNGEEVDDAEPPAGAFDGPPTMELDAAIANSRDLEVDELPLPFPPPEPGTPRYEVLNRAVRTIDASAAILLAELMEDERDGFVAAAQVARRSIRVGGARLERLVTRGFLAAETVRGNSPMAPPVRGYRIVGLDDD